MTDDTDVALAFIIHRKSTTRAGAYIVYISVCLALDRNGELYQ